MKTLQEPKTWKRPRLYYQAAFSHNGERIRIIYPNGRVDWVALFTDLRSIRPCWRETRGLKYSRDPDKMVAAMRAYDRNRNFPEQAIYLGEI